MFFRSYKFSFLQLCENSQKLVNFDKKCKLCFHNLISALKCSVHTTTRLCEENNKVTKTTSRLCEENNKITKQEVNKKSLQIKDNINLYYPSNAADKDFEKKFWIEYDKQIKKNPTSFPLFPDKIKYKTHYKTPVDKTVKVMRDDLVEAYDKLKYSYLKSTNDPSELSDVVYIKEEVFPKYCDVVIVGGGIVGTFVAYHLQALTNNALNVVVVEKDLSFSKSSTVLSVGGFRQQFSCPENIVLSKYGMDFLQHVNMHLSIPGEDAPSIPISFGGYLTLASENGYSKLENNYLIQKEHGSHVQMLTKRLLKEQFPWLNLDGIEAGVFGGQREGWVDPWSLLMALNKKAKSMGVKFVNGEVIESELEVPENTTGVYYDKKLNLKNISHIQVKLKSGEIRDINAASFVIAAGCWSNEVGHIFGVGTDKNEFNSIPIPVEPRKRYVYCIRSPNGPVLQCPLVIDPTGAYFRREGLSDMYLCGVSPEHDEEPSIDDLTVDLNFFEDKVWPLIAKRCPSFETLKLHSAWAGYYDYNTFDQNGIIGRYQHIPNLYIATGFSGHGLQHAAGTGRVIADTILGNKATIDTERLHFERVHMNKPQYECNVY